jgi:hypothetical protein
VTYRMRQRLLSIGDDHEYDIDRDGQPVAR